MRCQIVSSHVLRRMEDLERAAVRLREGAHLSIGGLPQTGKSTFLRQLTRWENREQLHLDRDYLMVLLDGRGFVDSSLEQVWGAIVAALNRAYDLGRSVLCSKDDARAISHDDLKEAFHRFRGCKPILIFDNCSHLCLRLERSVCRGLLRLPKKYSPTLITVPGHLPVGYTCSEEVRDQFVPMGLRLLSPEEAVEFAAGALSQLDMDKDLENDLLSRIVDWVGGNLPLLDSACYWAISLSEKPIDAIVLCNWLSKEGRSSLRSLEHFAGSGWLGHPVFRRVLHEVCSLDAQQLYTRWWRTLSEQEQMILLAVDELQRFSPQWENEMKELLEKELLQEKGGRYVIRPKLWNDFVSRLHSVRNAGRFRLDLKNIRVVYVDGTPCKLSPEQAYVFFRLFLHKGHVVPYSRLYADLYAPYGKVAEEITRKVSLFPTVFSMIVDQELNELRRILKGGKAIERVPPYGDALDGYRLAVPPED